MPEPPRRIVLEKSRSVRRRYQRSNKRLQFTASQIEHIEREEEREHRAQKLREREKKRLANKKKKAVKEARVREERKRLGLPDPAAPHLPSSQSLLSKFLAPAKEQPIAEEDESVKEEDKEDTESQGTGDTETELGSCVPDKEENSGNDGTPVIFEKGIGFNELSGLNDEEDEFSDCSIFYDEEIIRKVDMELVAPRDNFEQYNGWMPNNPQDAGQPKEAPAIGDSFQDDTAACLEECFKFHEFETDEEFKRELIKLDTVM